MAIAVRVAEATGAASDGMGLSTTLFYCGTEYRNGKPERKVRNRNDADPSRATLKEIEYCDVHWRFITLH